MWEIALFLILLILPIALIYLIDKYKLFETQRGLDKLYTYSKYLVYTIKDENVFKNPRYIKIFKKYLKNKKNVFYVLHTDSRVISAEHIDYINPSNDLILITWSDPVKICYSPSSRGPTQKCGLCAISHK